MRKIQIRTLETLHTVPTLMAGASLTHFFQTFSIVFIGPQVAKDNLLAIKFSFSNIVHRTRQLYKGVPRAGFFGLQRNTGIYR